MRSREKKRLVSVLSSASTTKWAPNELLKGRHRTEQCVHPQQAYGAAPVRQSSSQPGPATRGHAGDRSPAPAPPLRCLSAPARSALPPRTPKPRREHRVTFPAVAASAPRCRRQDPHRYLCAPLPRRRPRGAMPPQRSGPGGRRAAEPRYSPAAGSASTSGSVPADRAARHSTKATQRARRPIPLGSEGPCGAPPTPAFSPRPARRRHQSAAALTADYGPLAAAHASPGNGWLYMARSDWLGGGPARPPRPPVSK